MSTQVRHAFIYAIPILIANLVPFLTLPLYTRAIPPEAYGALALAQAFAFFCTGLISLGVSLGYERNFFECKTPEESDRLLFSALSFSGFSLIAAGVIITQFSAEIAEILSIPTTYRRLIYLNYAAATLEYLKQYFMIHQKNSENAKAYSTWMIVTTIIATLSGLILVLSFKWGAEGIVYGQILGNGVVLLTLTVKLFLRSMPKFSFSLIWACLVISLPLTPRVFFKLGGTQFDKYIIGVMQSMGGVGVYNVGQKISTVTFAFMTALENVFTPRVYKGMFESPNNGHAIGHYLTPFAYFSVLLALLVGMFSEEALFILVAKGYEKAADVITIFSMYYSIMFFGKQPQLIFAKKTSITTILSLTGMGLSMGLMVPFVRTWGFKGAAWAMFLSGVINVAASSWVLCVLPWQTIPPAW